MSGGRQQAVSPRQDPDTNCVTCLPLPSCGKSAISLSLSLSLSWMCALSIYLQTLMEGIVWVLESASVIQASQEPTALKVLTSPNSIVSTDVI